MKKVAPGKNLSKFYLLLTLAQPPRGTAASEAERNAVASEVQQIASVRAGQEERQRKAAEKAMLRKQFFSGKMKETSQTAKDIADEELKSIGFNIQDPSTWTEKSFFIMKRSIGTELANQYKT